MSALDRLNSYLAAAEKRLRWQVIARGLAIAAAVALLGTCAAVLYTNALRFSETSLLLARLILFFVCALAFAFGLVIPWLGLNRKRSARMLEQRFPEFDQRLLTIAESDPKNPLLQLVAMDAGEIAQKAEPRKLVPAGALAGMFVTGAIAVTVLGWLIADGPGFWGYGASLLWTGPARTGPAAYYDVLVSPGDRTLRRRAELMVSAQLVGFQAPSVRLKARANGGLKWEDAPMQPQTNGAGYEFLFAAVNENTEYYVEAAGVRSKTYRLTVVDLPTITKLKTTYHFPAYSGMKDEVEDPGGDLRAIAGTVGELSIETDKSLDNGVIVLDDGTKVPLEGSGKLHTSKISITKDGSYHIAVMDKDQVVRLTDDYFIEARQDTAPSLRIIKPGRDAKVSPIEEVNVVVEADDDFGLRDMALHYTVNGGEEKRIPLIAGRVGAKEVEGKTMISLEDFNLKPGDVIGMYASAKDARATTKTDIFFLEAQPFEKNYIQSQQSGGGGGGEQEREEQISKRQKEIIAATWNEVRTPSQQPQRGSNSKFLAEMQAKLRDQAKSLAQRVRSRQLSGTNDEFKNMMSEIDGAVKETGEAADKLKAGDFNGALPPEQRALQHILRIEASFRDIQVAFGQRGGGGGGGGAGRDLDNLFDLELDTEKNQYETGQRGSNSQQQQKVDEMAQRLEQLARRQQQLADQQQRQGQNFQQKWQQELLRREAEELRRQLEQMSRGEQSQEQQASGGQSNGQSGSQSSQGGQQQQQQQQQQQMSREQREQLQQALDRLRKATDDMRKQASSQEQGSAGGQRASERLDEAKNILKGMRQQQSASQTGNLSDRASDIARRQAEFERKMKEAYGNGQDPRAAGMDRAKNDRMAQEKQQLANDLEKLEGDMNKAAREMAGTQPGASSKIREALGDSQAAQTKARMSWETNWIRRGQGGLLGGYEQAQTQQLDKLKEQLADAQRSFDKDKQAGGRPGDKQGDRQSGGGDKQGDQEPGAAGGQGEQQSLEQALRQVERMRNELSRLSQQRQQQGKGQQRGGQQPGQQQGQQSGQQGQQQGQQPGQQSGQQGGQQQGGQQAGNQPGGRQGGQQGGELSPDGRGQQAPGDSARNGGGVGNIFRNGELPNRELPGGNPEQVLRDAVRDIGRLRQAMRDNPDLAREIGEVARNLQGVVNGPELDQRLQRQVMPSIETLELVLRRKLEENGGGQVRSAAGDRTPEGYAEKVAEYFRRLSKAK